MYERNVLKKIDLIVAGSEDAKKVIIRKGFDKDKVVVFPATGIETALFRKDKKNICNKLKIEKNSTCLFLGRLEEEKGIRYILKAKEILDKKNKTYAYLFVGSGALSEELNALSKSDKSIKLIEWIDYYKLPKLYNSAKIFLYPSIPTRLWEEQFGYSIAEAMSCGLPAISTDMSGPREIIRNMEDGFIIPSRDAKELADKIEILMKNKVIYSKFSGNAIKNIRRFDNSIIAEKIYSEIMNLIK